MVKKACLIILGILLVVVFELSLSFIGRIFLYARNSNPPLHNEGFTKRILCIGDSHTFGVGTSSNYSYPNQLERLLNLNNPQNSFNVVNLGIPGNSTKSQIERLEDFLDKNRTDFVILLTGRNNYYEVKAWDNKSFPRNIAIKARKMKTYKIMDYALSKVFKRSPREDINGPVERTKYEDYMRYQLNRAKSLCEKHGSKLILLSYYNSHDEYIEEFAKDAGMLYLNLCNDFSKSLPEENIDNFISRDSSHMSADGYRLFAELLYNRMLSRGEDLGLGLNPLSERVERDRFCPQNTPSYLHYVQGKSIFYEN